MPDASAGWFALGGVALAEALRVGGGLVGRRRAVQDRQHVEAREDDTRWRDDRRQAHKAFLGAATRLEEELQSAQQALSGSWCFRPPQEPDGSLAELEEAIGPWLSELELIGSEAAHERAVDWVQALHEAVFLSLLAGLDEAEADAETSFSSALSAVERARADYVAAARCDLGTSGKRS